MKKILTGILPVFLLLLIKPELIISQDLANDKKEILEYGDKRTSNEKLIQYLHSLDSETRVSAINALAGIADSNTVSELNFLLAGPYKDYPLTNDIQALTFLLNQIQSKQSKDMLKLMLNENSGYNDLEKSAIIISLGSVGDEDNLNDVLQYFELKKENDPDLQRALALSIARFALRKIKNEKAADVLRDIASKTKDIITQRNIAFALWRIGDKALLVKAAQEIYDLTKSEDPQTRMWAYNAMGKLQEKLLLAHVLESFNAEMDWRVKVNMLNSLTNFKLDSIPELTEQLLSILGDGISDDNEHVSLTAINVLGKLFADLKSSGNEIARSRKPKLMEEFIFGLDSAKALSWRIRSELANSMSLVFKDESKDALIKTFKNTDDYDLKSGVLKAFGNFDDEMVYKEVRDLVSADVQKYNVLHPDSSGALIGSKDLAKMYRGFVDMLSNLDEKVGEDDRNTFRLIFTEFAGSKDPAIVDISLSSLKDSLYLKYRSETSMVMGFDYNELKYPEDADVILMFIDTFGELNDSNAVSLLEENLRSENFEIAKASADAIEKIMGKKSEFAAKPRTDFDWDYLEGISGKKNITIKTNKGDINIELLPDVAPFTVMNFLKLSEKNYYDNTVFHRVVSNFVIQGGDPTGTGYGSPGYSIRSEFSPLSYERGMVGMASSGKDTEGSQFFITHSATPHLDGKYTIFGRVIDGMDVVDKIMIGDYIESVKINPR
ncbi:MAG: peptidylprolyl isomerase [Ignavibacteria bacterium]